MASPQALIWTLLATLVLELPVGALVARNYTSVGGRFLLVAVLANIATQALLWAVLTLAYAHYWPALLSSEVAIWLIEACCFQLALKIEWRSAWRLSLAMNATSFLVGLFLPL